MLHSFICEVPKLSITQVLRSRHQAFVPPSHRLHKLFRKREAILWARVTLASTLRAKECRGPIPSVRFALPKMLIGTGYQAAAKLGG